MLIEGIRNVAASYATTTAPSSVVASEPAAPPPPVRTGQLPYVSPVLQYDNDAAVAILQFRDGGSGDVEMQYPSKRVVREYQLRGRETGGSDVPAPGEDDGDSRSGGNSLLSLARSAFAPTTTSATLPGFSGASGVGISAAVASAPTVVIAGGGNVSGGVNFVA